MTQTRFFAASVFATVVSLAACSGTVEESKPAASPEPPPAVETPVFVGPEATSTLAASGALILDARDPAAYAQGHLPGAISAPWQSFTDGEKSGVVVGPAELQERLREHGVDDGERIVVYGAWDKEWGEEGRIFWMLEYAGMRTVSVMEGGVTAWSSRGGRLSTEPSVPKRGTITVALNEAVQATTKELEDAARVGKLVVLDTRERQEYDGATPYGSAYGGHIDGAQHFYWKDVFSPNGQLHREAILRTRFADMGIEDDSVVVSYCTGGIRSGFVYTVMRHLGYKNPQNYDGSWWEWSQTHAQETTPTPSAAP